jgi:hypothetical protein
MIHLSDRCSAAGALFSIRDRRRNALASISRRANLAKPPQRGIEMASNREEGLQPNTTTDLFWDIVRAAFQRDLAIGQA